MTSRLSFMRCVGLVVLVAFSLFACDKKPSAAPQSTNGASASTITIRVGYRPRAMLDVTPVVIERRGMAAEGLRVELVPLSSAQDGFAKFAAKEVDALAGLPLEAIVAQVADPRLPPSFRIYAVQADSPELGWAAIIAGKKTTATRVADLGNQLTASLPTDQGEYLLKRILKAAGVSEAEIKTTRYSLASPLGGLASGEHAALFGPDPAIAMGVAEGYRVIERGTLSRYLADGQPFPVAASVIGADFVERHPSASAAFRELVDKATAIVKAEPAVVRDYFRDPRYGGLTPEVCTLLVFPLMESPGPALRKVTNGLLADLHRDGLLKHNLSIEPLLLEKN